MQVPPPNVLTSVSAQKVRPPASALPPNVQHWLYIDSVQSLEVLQSRTVCTPLQVVPSTVPQAEAATQRVTIVPVVQFGAVPPVIGMRPQQISPPVQSLGAVQGFIEPTSAVASLVVGVVVAPVSRGAASLPLVVLVVAPVSSIEVSPEAPASSPRDAGGELEPQAERHASVAGSTAEMTSECRRMKAPVAAPCG
jgi:hypothetical protein